MIDSHCHLHFPELLDDLPKVLGSMDQAGVTKAIVVATKISEAPVLRNLMDNHNNIYATLGVHPCSAMDNPVHQDKLANEISTHDKFVAIGECGLDRFHTDTATERKAQQECLKLQLELALQLKLPVVIHTRNSKKSNSPDCIDSTITILRQYCEKGLSAVLHCFTGSIKQAQEALEIGCWLSFTGIVTFKNATDILNIAATIPLERLMIETDSPYLAPSPHRGSRNEPAYLIHIAEAIARKKGISRDEFVAATNTTTQKFYRLN